MYIYNSFIMQILYYDKKGLASCGNTYNHRYVPN